MAISGGDGSIILTTKVDESGLSSGLSKLKSGVGAFGKAFAVQRHQPDGGDRCRRNDAGLPRRKRSRGGGGKSNGFRHRKQTQIHGCRKDGLLHFRSRRSGRFRTVKHDPIAGMF